MIRRIKNYLIRKFYMYHYKVEYGCRFEKKVYVDLDTIINGYIDLQQGTRLVNCDIGKGTNLGPNNKWTRCKIGKFCLTDANNRNIYGHHPTSKYVAMNSKFYWPQEHGYANEVMYSDVYKYADKEKKFYNIIGNDVYITNDVLILEGVKIGDGAVITPGSVVTKNVPPYAIVRGNPAKIVTYRFTEEDILFLEKLQWWDKDDEWLENHVKDFNDIKSLKKRILEEEVV